MDDKALFLLIDNGTAPSTSPLDSKDIEYIKVAEKYEYHNDYFKTPEWYTGFHICFYCFDGALKTREQLANCLACNKKLREEDDAKNTRK